MSPTEIIMIAGMVGVTFGIRYFLFAFADRIRMPAWMETSLKYIPPAVLIAITVPAVVLPKGDWHLSVSNPYLFAAVVTTAAGIISKNLLATIAVGLAAFFIYRLVI